MIEPKRPIDDPRFKQLFDEASDALIAREFPDGRRVGRYEFVFILSQWAINERCVNLVSNGGLVESARTILPEHQGGSIIFSDRSGDKEPRRSMRLEFIAGATMFDEQSRKQGSLILESAESPQTP